MRRKSRTSEERKRRKSRSLVGVMALASVTVMAVDAQGGADSPFDPARDVLGEVLGPAQESAATVARPLREVPEFFTSNRELRAEVKRLEAEAARLRGQVNTTSQLRYRAAELEGLLTSSKRSGLAMVPARVVAIGPAQSFSHTVTIDAGTSSGLRPDMTVLNNDGLVGPRHRRASRVGHGAAGDRPALDGRGSARLQRRGGLPARPGVAGRDQPARPRPGRQLPDPGQGRRRGHLGQPGRRPLRAGGADRQRAQGLLQPAGAGQARGGRALRRLLRPRRGRGRRGRARPRGTVP